MEAAEADIKSYCRAIRNGELTQVHIDYHVTAYGFPIEDDNELFGRLILEINQAGLLWDPFSKSKKISGRLTPISILIK